MSNIPNAFLCPITHQLFNSPLIDREGNSYEASAILEWLQTNSTSPITRSPLFRHDLAPNRALKEAIRAMPVHVRNYMSDAASPTPSSASSGTPGGINCQGCEQEVDGMFVGTTRDGQASIYHVNCFRCQDCEKSVQNCSYYPNPLRPGRILCEMDYFRRIGMSCNRCHQPIKSDLRESKNFKYHHGCFTCNAAGCIKAFGPQELLFEEEGDIFCRYHHSILYTCQ
jgi:U-box domain/LIM domain